MCVSWLRARLYVEVRYSNIPTTLNIVTGKCIRKHKSLRIKNKSSSVLTLTLFCTQHIFIMCCGLCLDCGTHGTVNYLSQHGKKCILHVCVKQKCDQKHWLQRIWKSFFFVVFSIKINGYFVPPQNKSLAMQMWLFIKMELFYV